MSDPNRSAKEGFDLIEAMLAHSHPRKDSAAIRAALELHFVSPAAMFRASPYMLESLGVHPSDALLLSQLPSLVRCMRVEACGKHPQIGRLNVAAEYLSANFFALPIERFYMFCVDFRGRLRERILLQEGIEDGALFSLKSMLAHIVRVHPSAVILAHNHPAGTMRPSQDDIDCTLDALRALTVVGVPLLDHVIVARNRVVSMRDNGFVPACIWLNQLPGHRLLENWLETQPAQKKTKKRKRAD